MCLSVALILAPASELTSANLNLMEQQLPHMPAVLVKMYPFLFGANSDEIIK